MQSPVYNSLNLEMSLASSRVRWALCLILFSQLSFATDWHDPVSQLAAKISAAVSPGVVSPVINHSRSNSLDAVEEARVFICRQLKRLVGGTLPPHLSTAYV